MRGTHEPHQFFLRFSEEKIRDFGRKNPGFRAKKSGILGEKIRDSGRKNPGIRAPNLRIWRAKFGVFATKFGTPGEDILAAGCQNFRPRWQSFTRRWPLWGINGELIFWASRFSVFLKYFSFFYNVPNPRTMARRPLSPVQCSNHYDGPTPFPHTMTNGRRIFGSPLQKVNPIYYIPLTDNLGAQNGETKTLKKKVKNGMGEIVTQNEIGPPKMGAQN